MKVPAKSMFRVAGHLTVWPHDPILPLMDATIASIQAASAEIVRKSQATGERHIAWAEWADGTRATSEAMTGPEINRQIIAWKRQGATRVGYTRDAA